ncbi:uncharacterized protein [Prorops nasuta]|uniref:uncharacterized protein n=1 Tax=Prorops nasuta TaxID=863751 RepID=UPI0034CEAB12
MGGVERTPPQTRNSQSQEGQSLLDLDNPTEDLNMNAGENREAGESASQISQAATTDSSKSYHIQALWKEKLTAFISEAPDVWFYIVEAEFAAGKITSDDTKYLAVIRALDAKTLAMLTDVLRQPPEKNKYTNLKSAILNRLLESRTKQVDKLLRNLALGDKKPSTLLREMQDLAKGEIGQDILRQLWLERLPAHIRPHLLVTNNLNLEVAAEMADRLLEVFNASYVMATSTSGGQPRNQNDKLEQKLNDMQALIVTCMQEIKELKMQNKTEEVSGGSHHSRNRSRSKTPSRQKCICYYHERFGKEARKCTSEYMLNEVFKQQQGN